MSVFSASVMAGKTRASSPATTADATSAALVLDAQQAQRLHKIPGQKNGSLLYELAEIFREEMPGRLKEMSAQAGARQGTALAQRAHALAGSCASIGGRQMQAAATALEFAAAAGDWLQVTAQLATLEAAWDRLDRALTAHEQGGQP